MPTVVYLRPGADERRDRDVVDELENSELTVLRTSDPVTAERYCERRADVVLLRARGLGSDQTVDLAARFIRSAPIPVVVWCDLSGDALLELLAVGAVDFLISEPSIGELRARLLGAIEHQHTVHELRRGYAAFRTLFHDAVSPMVMADVDTRLVDANTAFLELLGYTQHELRALDVAAITLHDDSPSREPFAVLARGERSSYRFTGRFRRKDGTIVWANVSASEARDPLSGKLRVIADLHDITGEVESHDALARARGHFEALFDEVPLALLVLDLDRMRFTDVNRAAETMFGFSDRELLALGLSDLWVGRGASPEAVRELLRGGKSIGPTHQRLHRADRSSFDAELTITRFGNGPRTHLLVARDITARLQLERDLERARRQLAHPTASPAAPVRQPEDGKLTILLIDDDEAVLMLVQEMLEHAGHHVIAATGGRPALDAVHRHRVPVDLLVVDATLNNPSPSEIAGELAQATPGVPVLVISGYLDDILSTKGSLGPDSPFLSKPFTANELLDAVAAAVSGSGESGPRGP